MESVVDASTKIFNELSSDDREVGAKYFKYFESDARLFSEHMAKAVGEWRVR